MCGTSPCNPMTEACTWSEAHKWRCLARHVLAMPFDDRKPWIQAFKGNRRRLSEEIKLEHWRELQRRGAQRELAELSKGKTE